MGWAKAFLAAAVLGMAGCSVMPYQSESPCEGTSSYGKCASVSAAYNEAVTGESAGPEMRKEGEDPPEDAEEGKPKEDTAPEKAEETNAAATGKEEAEDRYRAARYREIASLIEEPVTPMVRAPRAVRVLILPYPERTHGRRLYMPRYVYFLGREPSFVLGDYLTPRSTTRHITDR